MRPLDRVTSIRAKLGAVIVAAVVTTIVINELGVLVGIPLPVRGVGAGLVALTMARVLARGMTSPLREMASAARAMARGDYGRRVTATSRDEVGELARAFNRMAADLAEVDRIRRDLVANVSHDLRTPISALQAVLENVIDEVERADPTMLRGMLEQVRRLGRLVEQLLDLSRLESGTIPLDRKRFAARALLEQAATESAMHARQRGGGDVGVAVRVEPDDLELDADPERIHQVVTNLVDNALRHSPDGGVVLVRARRSGSGATIDVVDDGPGIPRSDARRVFERFYRSDAARSSAQGQSGLGLAIARWIVDLHGGDIRVDADHAPGCRMVVDLPDPA
ncbi:MAG TPA: ATP-binding protein [Actinomycetota bacterium]|nr:ATP-binding protein [Actinomycetota bacterium]